MTNSICIFIDKWYSTGNSAPTISHRHYCSEQDSTIYLDAGWLLINSPSNRSHLIALIGCPGHVISLYFIRCGHRCPCDFISCPCSEVDLLPGRCTEKPVFFSICMLPNVVTTMLPKHFPRVDVRYFEDFIHLFTVMNCEMWQSLFQRVQVSHCMV